MNIFEIVTKPLFKIEALGIDVDLATIGTMICGVVGGYLGLAETKKQVKQNVEAFMAEERTNNGGAQKGE